MASIFSESPTTCTIMLLGPMSTTEARKVSTMLTISGRLDGSAWTLIRASSRATMGLALRSTTLITSMIL
ncbi:hypothetical protein D3C86_2249130 [compost metagenome]